jgi:hexosaminidase
MPTTPLPLVPQPSRAERLDHPDFVLSEAAAIHAPDALRSSAQFLADRLATCTGWDFPVNDRTGDIRIKFNLLSTLPPQSYQLLVAPKEILISAATAAGAFYAVQTLLQLFPPAVYDQQPRPDLKWTAPCADIEDAPRFGWRGVMVDSSRFFQPLPALKKFIDVLAQHKINVLHWHLVDDQGWRIEIKRYPKLTAIGSKRRESPRGHMAVNLRNGQSLGGDGKPVEGYYTQDEVRELVAYAAARHINILPEIEMPGHAQAAIAAYPELGLLAEAKPVSCKWGIHDTLFNTKPETITFLENVLTEVVALFPFAYLHIGGDEAIKPQWEQDAATQAHLKTLGLKDEHELQSWFIRQAETILKKLDRKLVGWDEILEGGLAPSATVMSWRGLEGAIESAKHGNDAIMCPNPFVYFDHYQAEDWGTEPLAIGGNSPLAKVHGYEPIPAELTADQAKHIIGVQGQLWTEYIATPTRLEFMAFPRVCALAELAWCPAARPDFAHFLTRLKTHLRRLDVQDVRYRAPLEYVHA